MKSMKKLVLAGLVLLASVVGLLSLAGCKNDSVPEPTRYTVSFDKGDNSEYTGDLPADITVESGTKLTAEQLKGLADTDNYIFEGWYDGETKAEGGTYTVTKDVTLEAKWKPRDQVQINFKVSGNTVELSSEPAEATIHYTTDGTESKESWDEYANPIEISSKTTIKAYAEKLGELKPSDVAEKTYLVVTFNANGGSEVAPQIVESGQTIEKPLVTYPGTKNELYRWVDEFGQTVMFPLKVEKNMTLTAQWGIKVGDTVYPKTSEVQVLFTKVTFASLDKVGVDSEVFISGRDGEIQPFVRGSTR